MTLDIWLNWSMWAGSALLSVALVLAVSYAVVRVLATRRQGVRSGWRRVRWPLGATLAFSSLRVASSYAAGGDSELRSVLLHGLLIGLIGSAVWLIGTLLVHLLRLSEKRLAARISNDRGRRRTRTQLGLLRRLVTVALIVLGVGLVLLTFPGVSRLGAGMLASAGLLSVVAGLAAQSSLANLFAGIQLAFSDAIRIDDVVVVEGESGTIEDITLTYVVLRIWDQRRLILPSTYFITTPFTNWTRTGTEITGTVFFDLDWQVDVAALRAQLDEILDGTDLWDRRAHSLVVTDATDGHLTVRAVLSARNSGELFDLQCLVRERIAGWLRARHPEGLPVRRIATETRPVQLETDRIAA